MSRSFRVEGREFNTRDNDLVIGGAVVSDEAPVDGQLMRYDASTGKWRPHDPSGGGTVTTSGTPASGKLAKFSGGTVITNGDLIGDVTTAGGLAATLANTAVTPATYGDSTHIVQITVDSKGRITSAVPVAIAGLILTKVVDIGPTTNNGPGPNNVGIKNWSASPTIIVAHPGTGKFANFISGSVQYKPNSAAYVDPNSGGKVVSLQYASSTTSNLMAAVPSNLGLDTLTAYNFPSILGIAGGSVGASSFPVLQSESEDKAIVIGFVPGSSALELTTGDGQVRITVKYSVDDILT